MNKTVQRSPRLLGKIFYMIAAFDPTYFNIQYACGRLTQRIIDIATLRIVLDDYILIHLDWLTHLNLKSKQVV